MVNIDRTTKYAKQVLSGEIIAGQLVKLACARHLEDIKRSKKKDFVYYFDVETAERTIDFFKFLKHSKGEWASKTIELELWQCFIFGNIFGWKHKKTKLRKYNKGYVQVAKKNGKSTTSAGLALYGLMADGEDGAEIYSAATKKDQAKIIFEEAQRMVRASKDISKYLEVLQNNINMPSTNSKFQPLSSDANTLDGPSIQMALIDELHAHKTREVYDILENGTSARRQPLIFSTTTAGFDINNIAYEIYSYGCNVLKKLVPDESYFFYIAQLDEEDDWTNPDNWIKANPNLGISVKFDDLLQKCKKALEIPAAQNNFKCKHLNMWTNQEVMWMDIEKWKLCNEKYNIDDLLNKPCYLGMDLSTTTDLTAVNFEFPLENGRYALINHSFIPEDKILEKEKTDKIPIKSWIERGYITATPGNTVDYEWVMSYIMEQSKKYKILEACYDPWNATQFANNLMSEGLETVEVRQGYKTMSEPTKDIEKCVLDKKIIHFNNPVLAYAVNNAVVKIDPAGNIKLDKSKTTKRIDPLMAFVTSHVRAMNHKYNEKNDINEYIMSDEFSL